ncbi:MULTISPECIES: DnaJ C-terminal domain-containing protein [unclassified Pseudofrankia]|uniref:DnaJ C-terminal domain-containing protein n=1 Tax=unclassified Pseudofrankia TaxID=2994372 RepID=UPI0008D9EE35|nr:MULTISPECIES: DnaJ C-terminal domain-containing protein [unclassified Pseudofrankia]MDT3445355.1 DnaJ C-terminal domain-containing protein [Pseudofrankia sp. BMG5.37]OHV51331.1 molecular chaperone DnaJ [Pseudofrankia sp. BMG5.36]
MARDYYEVLGVGRGASAEEIQQAYRRLARRYHPDVNADPAAEERFKEVGEAYHVLSDPKTRARYDRFGEDFRRLPEDFDERVAAGVGADTGWARGGGGRVRGVRVGPGGTGGPGGFGAGGFEDLFGDFFGAGRGARGATGPIPGADQEAELAVTVEEAYRGGRRRVALAGPDGPRSYQVTIPPGVVDGQRIRLAGEGGRGSSGGAAGDLYLRVRLAPHPRYRLRGRDISVTLPVAPWEAALGATAPVTTPGGEVKVHVPAGSSTGRRLRLRGEGMPNRAGAPGDLYAEVSIAVPATLTEREGALFQELATVSDFDPREGRAR